MKNLKNGKKSEVINMQPTEKFDLVVSFDGNIKQQNLGDICRIEEIELALKKQGEFFYIKETEFHNILLIELNSDPFVFAQKLRNTLNIPYQIMPINSVVPTNLDYIKNQVINMCRDNVIPGQTCAVRCDLKGRRHIESKEVILTSLYKILMNKLKIVINESKPDWMIQIQVVGENTGINILKQY